MSGTQAGNYSRLALRPRRDGWRVRRLTAGTYDDDSRGHDEQGVITKTEKGQEVKGRAKAEGEVAFNNGQRRLNTCASIEMWGMLWGNGCRGLRSSRPVRQHHYYSERPPGAEPVLWPLILVQLSIRRSETGK